MGNYKALIIDDEYTGRELLKKMIDWEKIDYDEPDLASNGAQALQMVHDTQYSIIFTDIEMPIMNGLDFIKIAKKEYGLKNIVIISCHENFNYAKEALRMGVKDYIIKDLALKHELEALAISVKAVSEDTVERKKEENRFEFYLKLALQGKEIPADNFPYSYVSVFKISIDDYDKLCFGLGDDVVAHRAEHFMEKLSCLASYYDDNGNIYALYESWETDSVLYFISATYNIAEGIRNKTAQFELGSVTIGVSNLINDVKDLDIACREADKAVEMRILQGPEQTILYKNIGLKKSLVDMEQIRALLKKIELLWMAGNRGCVGLIDKLYAFEVFSGFADINYFYYINTQLWTLIVINGQKKGYTMGYIFDTFAKDINDINNMESPEKMAHFFKTILLKLSPGEDNSADIVLSAISLIEEEYNKEISLAYLADKLHVNKSYLCRIFKEKVGENIVPYIEGIRIGKAKELLCNTDKKLHEISSALGYASATYFSYSFKKETGYAPSDYRKRRGEE